MGDLPKIVFISRSLKKNSVFQSQLEAVGWQVHGESLLRFTALPFTELPESDWIFFYSKKGVKFFFRRVQQAAIPISPTTKFATIGKGTAQTLQKFERQATFIGTGKPTETAEQFLYSAINQRVLFPQAAHSRQSIQQQLGEKIKAIDLVVYENVKRTDFELPDCKVLVFTSPMNVDAYFSQRKLMPFQKVVAIGQTTAQALRRYNIEEFQVAAQPDEEHLAKAVLLVTR